MENREKSKMVKSQIVKAFLGSFELFSFSSENYL